MQRRSARLTTQLQKRDSNLLRLPSRQAQIQTQEVEAEAAALPRAEEEAWYLFLQKITMSFGFAGINRNTTNGKQTIEINITNSQLDLLLENVSLSVDGFLLSRMIISPKIIPIIEYGQTKTFLLSVDVPQYYKYQNISLKISIKARSKLQISASYSDFEKTSEIILVVLQVTKESALAGITGAVTDISALNENGISLSFLMGFCQKLRKR